jgi:protein arginine kinase activator
LNDYAVFYDVGIQVKCEICGTREAVIHIQQITGNDEIELHLCEKCAASKGITTSEDRLDFSITNLLTGLVDVKSVSKASETKKNCPQCGLTLSKFKKKGKLGCNECYSVFSREIGRIVEKMFGGSRHKGKYPKRLVAYKTYLIDLEELKKKLSAAVKKEDYEEAARLRDRIKELESFSEEPAFGGQDA